TILLDEITDLPMDLQAKLLRVLQEREVERLGSHQKIKLDIRIIAASNRILREQVEQGAVREDLFYSSDVL
ncbi:AAA family ATPase, partial [Pseudoalteromonas sp. S1609]|uniref:sigma 54-interacting transcriptional regulator n=1 Tax=Pseudoalteromonas sp. S1609 TaxID=579505 RepID=UPI00110AB818